MFSKWIYANAKKVLGKKNLSKLTHHGVNTLNVKQAYVAKAPTRTHWANGNYSVLVVDNDVKVHRMPNQRRESSSKSTAFAKLPTGEMDDHIVSSKSMPGREILSDVQRDSTLHFQNEHVFQYWLLASVLVGLVGVLIIMLG